MAGDELKQSIKTELDADKENTNEAEFTKRFAETQATQEAPCDEKVHGGEEVKGVKFARH
jgi:hypothetical protein